MQRPLSLSNPSANWAILSIADYNKPLQCNIHSLEGKLIQTQAVHNAQTILDIHSFPVGVYLVDLRNASGHIIWRSKLIKQ
jgi:hypothetical protein